MRRPLAWILVLLASLAVPASTSAAEADPAPEAARSSAAVSAPISDRPNDERAKGFDYTLPMIVTDVALMGTLAGSWTLGRAHEISPGLAVGMAGGAFGAYVASGALYHAAFDLRKKTALSLVVRVLAPLTFGASGALGVHDSESKACRRRGIPEGSCDHDGTETGALIGTLIGMLGATVAEATILVPDGRKPRDPSGRSALSVAPSFVPVRSGGQLGLVGTF